MITRFYNGFILKNHQLYADDLWIFHDKISVPQPHAVQEVDLEGHILAPGYIDIQMNGGFGIDLTSNPAQVETVAKKLPYHGVTSFLPTVVTTETSRYLQILQYLQPKCYENGAEVLGVHLEGPFLNPEYCGAHDQKSILGCKEAEKFLHELGESVKFIKLMTFAPELKHATELMKLLAVFQIVAAAGHTGASYEAIQKAKKYDLRLITHLYNAMAPFHHRNPGVIGAALDDPNMDYSLIADLVHVAEPAVKIAWKSNPDGLILVSDASAAMNAKPGSYSLGDRKIHLNEEGNVIDENGKLAGTSVPLDEMVRRFHKVSHCSIVEAIEAATLKPSRLLKIHRKGNLNIGSDADFNVLDHDLNVIETYVRGKIV